MSFGKKLKAARLRAKLTQIEASARAGVPQPMWSVYESGKQTPNLSTAERLAKAVRVRLAVLV